MSSGARIAFNDPRRFGSMKLVPRAQLEQEPLLRALGPEPLGNAFDAAMLARACKGKKTSLKAALSRPEDRGRARQHLCLRGAAPRAAVAQAPGLDDREQVGRAARARGAAGRCHQGRARRMRSRPAARRCAIIAGPTASSAIFQHNFRVYDREGQPCPTPRLQGHHQAHRADRALDVLLPGLPEVVTDAKATCQHRLTGGPKGEP